MARLGLGACLGVNTAYAVNVARDLGPRIALYIVGYGPNVLWTYDAWYWLRTPILGTICGAIAGGAIYDGLIYQGDDSPMNQPWGNPKRLFSRRKSTASIETGSSTIAPVSCVGALITPSKSACADPHALRYQDKATESTGRKSEAITQ